MKVTATTLKKLEQENVQLNRYFYTNSELTKMLEDGVIFVVDRECKVHTNETLKNDNEAFWLVIDKNNYLAIALHNTSEVKVIMDGNHILRTVAVVDGVQYFISL